MLTKVIGFAVVVLIVVWVVSTPAGAGTDVHNWVSAILDFFSHLAKG